MVIKNNTKNIEEFVSKGAAVKKDDNKTRKSNTRRIIICLSESMIEEIDEILDQNPELYPNRTHFIRTALFDKLIKERQKADL